MRSLSSFVPSEWLEQDPETPDDIRRAHDRWTTARAAYVAERPGRVAESVAERDELHSALSALGYGHGCP